MIRFRPLVLTAICVLAMASATLTAAAQDEAAAPDASQTESEAAAPAHLNDPKAQEKIEDLRTGAATLTEQITKGLNDAQQMHFYTLYNQYNIIGTVGVVQKDVGKAIESCGEANPDMKDALDERFEAWNEAVNPFIEEARAKVENMVLAQDYADEKDLRRLLKNLDTMRVSIDSQIEKIPVNTPEACEYLREKMDETQERMVDLLRATLVSLPQTGSGDDG